MNKTRQTALIAALASIVAIWWVWAAFDPLPLIEDEYSYVLQSRIFASGHWTAPSPAIPEFFQQAHVLTQPAVASKFFPGHAFLLTIGAMIDSPAIVPLLLTGLTAALLFLLVRRVTNDWVGVLAVIIWLGDPINLRFRASYFSEVTTQAMWLIAWWALLEWHATRDKHSLKWMAVLAAAIGYGAITRPLTMLAFAVPVGAVVIHDVVRQKRWTDLGLGVLVGVCVLAVIPLWSVETTGDWKLTPQTLYTRDYLPYDHPGFGLDRTPPAMHLEPPNELTYRGFAPMHASHTLGNLPRIAAQRLTVIGHDEWWGFDARPRYILIPFVIIGLVSLNAAVGFGLVCSVALFLGYMTYGHWSEWTLYYFEAMPILSVLAALGVWRSIEWVRARRGTMSAGTVRRTFVTVSVVLAALTAYEVQHWHTKRLIAADWDETFHAELTKLPMHAAVIFVHYRSGTQPHASIVANSPHLDDEPIWIVNDLGERDRDLLQYSGPRIPLNFYEDSSRFEIARTLIGRPPK